MPIPDPTITERDVQIPGETGNRLSLKRVAQKASKARNNMYVRRWATHALKNGGNPALTRKQCEVILTALRKQCIWIPDPNGTEMIISPEHLLGEVMPDGTVKSFFAGSDCDDLASAFAAVCLCLGMRVKVVGHALTRSKNMGHVLIAVWDEDEKDPKKAWMYCEPTPMKRGNEWVYSPFGEWAITPTRERTIQLPCDECEHDCDADLCLRGPLARPPLPKDGPGDYIGVGSLGAFTEPLGTHEGDPMQAAILDGGEETWAGLGAPGDGTPTPEDTALVQTISPQLTGYLTATSDTVKAAKARALSSYNAMRRTAASLGILLPEGPGTSSEGSGASVGWSQADEAATADTFAQADLFSKFLDEAAAGTRQLWNAGNDIAVQALPGDALALAFVGPATTNQNAPVRVSLVDKTGPVHGPPLGLGLIWNWAIALGGVAGLAACSIAMGYAIQQVCGTIETVSNDVARVMITKRITDLVQDGKATPQQAADLSKAIGESSAIELQARAALQNTRNQGTPLAQGTNALPWLIGGAIVVGGILLLSREQKARGSLTGHSRAKAAA